MRLLQHNDDGELSLTQFFDDIPRYAILSHTWGPEEVTFGDMMEGKGMSKTSFDKIRFCGEQARRDGLQYFWVDTCCIDKTSSAELSEAINSMYQWYACSSVCYVYLEDLSGSDNLTESINHNLRRCRWFTRGWALQELLAPPAVHFYTRDWLAIGTKAGFHNIIANITGLPSEVVTGAKLPEEYSVKERMAWAAHRRTTLVEDEAYCLLGLFNVKMPLLYGEGSRAFRRLQEEIQKAHSSAILGTLGTGGMRLLVARSDPLEIKNVSAGDFPTYAILSHTWGQDEVSFQDLATGKAETRLGYGKIRKCCEQAIVDGFDYVWVDTCCIDKTSSAELQEAICSMYKWYKGAQICYAYLDDSGIWGPDSTLTSCRWFRRGWTLQELIAPRYVEFYDEKWNEIGTKLSLCDAIAQVTRIDPLVLRGADPTNRTVAERMSWAASRSTSRIEDKAYSLLGLFNVFMPMLYGEGSRAFVRLQEEIISQSEDYTIFAWKSERDTPTRCGIFAESPANFLVLGDPLSKFVDSVEHEAPAVLTSRGLHISLPLVTISEADKTYRAWICCLKSRIRDDASPDQALVCVQLIEIQASPRVFARESSGRLEFWPERNVNQFRQEYIYILPSGTTWNSLMMPNLDSKEGKMQIHVRGEAAVDNSTVLIPSDVAGVNKNMSSNIRFDEALQTLTYTFVGGEISGVCTLAAIQFKTFVVYVGFQFNLPWCLIEMRRIATHLADVDEGHGQNDLLPRYGFPTDFCTPKANSADRAFIQWSDTSITTAKIKIGHLTGVRNSQEVFHLHITHTE